LARQPERHGQDHVWRPTAELVPNQLQADGTVTVDLASQDVIVLDMK
jgi:hypothetical protein